MTKDLGQLEFGDYTDPKPNQVMKSIPEYELKAEVVHHILLETLQRHLSQKTEGYRCIRQQVLNVLVKAAEDSNLEAVCNDQAHGVKGNTLHEHLNSERAYSPNSIVHPAQPI